MNTKAMRILKTAVLMNVLLVTAIQAGCPNPKAARKAQERRLAQLGEEHIVVLATPLQTSSGNGKRFIVRQVWDRNNGDLRVNEEIDVTATNPSMGNCMGTLSPTESYILMLTPSPEHTSPRGFEILEAPVSGKRTKLRQRVWRELCGSYGQNCVMRVAMEPEKTFFRDSFSILYCKVDLAWWRVKEVVWEKDHRDVNTDYHRMAGIEVNVNDPADSFVMFKASHLHIGNYTCTVRDVDGNTATGTTSLNVKGPFEASLYTSCRDKDADKCMHGGTCRRMVEDFEGLLDTSICLCKGDYEGPRCENVMTGVTMLESGQKDKTDSNREIMNLTTAVVVLAVALVCTVIVALLRVRWLKRKQHRQSFNVNDYEDCKGDCLETPASTASERSQKARTVSLVSEVPITPRSRLSGHSS